MTQKITYCVQWNAVLNQARSKVMAQIVPAKIADPGSAENFLPSRLKSGDDVKDTHSGAGLFAPAPQHTQGFLIERHVPRLATLCILALDGEKPSVEVHGGLTQLESLTAPQSGVHR